MRAEVELVLAYLQRSTNLAKFLSYICEEFFNGRTDRLKEYTIAVEAFGRPETFQPKGDPIVRVHAMRLRQHLAEYYRGEGSQHPIQIRLPKGAYVPAFEVLASQPEEASIQSERRSAQGEPASAVNEGLAEPHSGAPKPRLRLWAYISGVVVLLSLALLGWSIYAREAKKASNGNQNPLINPVLGGQDELRILTGSSASTYIDKLGRLWVGDRYYSGGDSWKPLFGPITRVYDPSLWKTLRTGRSFKYDIPLKPGTYELHLHFFEDSFGVDDEHGGGEGSRSFDVEANGKPVLTEFDIVRDAGGARTADERVFLISPSADGFLHLKFQGRVESAILSGIELIPTSANRMRPIRIDTGATPYISSKQVVWRPDQYYSGGRRHEVNNPVTGTENPELFSTERFGNFNYTIPVADGTYTAILYFSESFFGTGDVSQSVGARVFDVSFNGTKILKDFDIYREAAGAHRVVRKEFHGLRPDALGKLVFTFHPNRNNPSINAIEIIPED